MNEHENTMVRMIVFCGICSLNRRINGMRHTEFHWNSQSNHVLLGGIGKTTQWQKHAHFLSLRALTRTLHLHFLAAAASQVPPCAPEHWISYAHFDSSHCKWKRKHTHTQITIENHGCHFILSSIAIQHQQIIQLMMRLMPMMRVHSIPRIYFAIVYYYLLK